MAVEIERKFLVKQNAWQLFKQNHNLTGEKFCQGYLTESETTVRIRIKGDTGWITVKGKTEGLSRLEFEYQIPVTDAEQMLNELCHKPLIEKQRFIYRNGSDVWEVDEFEGENAGLIVAEIELPAEDADFERPEWLGEEVSDDTRYFNACLARNPYSQW